MKLRFNLVPAVVLAAGLLTACDSSPTSRATEAPITLVAVGPANAAQAEDTEVNVLDWDDLVPEDFSFETLMQDYDVNTLSDDDPRALELFDELMERWKDAPVVEALDGQTIRLPGFVVPLEKVGRNVEEFLLVPYYGACIHVPPPPANQTVHVLARGQEYEARRLFDTVWVTGVIRVEHKSSELAESGYQLDAIEIAPYEE